jgi:hypothetical protein
MCECKLDFFQIYYKEDQREHLYDFAIPYSNQLTTPFLENDVITSLVTNSNADFISVVSWRLKQKRKSISSREILKASGGIDITKERILTAKFDVAILTPRPSEHKMLFMAQHWHGRVWTDSFTLLASFLSNELNIEVPDEIAHPIYGNHFIAKNKIYQEYIRTCIKPVINHMQKSDIFLQDSGYRFHKERMGDYESIANYETATGRTDWPIGVFLLERLFSIWINDKNLHMISL